ARGCARTSTRCPCGSRTGGCCWNWRSEMGHQGEGGHGHGHGVHGRVPGEHKARAPRSARVYVVTCSDSRTEATDEGGRILRDRLAAAGHAVTGSAIVPDDPQRIAAELDRAHASGAQFALVTGGTGLSSRDSTFEAISRAAVGRCGRAGLVGPALEELLRRTDAAARVQGDPVELVHAYSDPLDVEVAGLLCAALAYGRVDLFKPRLAALLRALGPSPGT